jgi:glucose/arabinose dehydrogenase
MLVPTVMSRSFVIVRVIIVPILLALLSADAARAQLRAELVANGFERPVTIVPDPLTPGTLIVLEQPGRARVIVNGAVQATPFLDLTSEVKHLVEQGLLGLAFSPDGTRVFVQFVKRRDPDLGIGDTVIARFRRSANPLVLDPASRFDLVWPDGQRIIEQPSAVHKGGNLVFGPDGYLYVGLGDGGAGGHAPGAQSPEVLLGKMLRIDVSVPDNHPTGYQIPADNPFVNGVPVSALHEIWAFGYRNPWRFSFDDFGADATGALIVGDVGEDTLEEINYEPAGRGGRNYGWYIREGTMATPNVSPLREPAYLPLTEPMAQYPHTIGRSVTGGFMYRGSTLSSFYRGRYFVADFYGAVYSAGLVTDAAGEGHVVDVMDHAAELGMPRLITTFGRGLDGELYFASLVGGSIYKIVPDTPDLPAPPSLTTNVTGSTVTLSWQSGAGGGPVLAYQLEAGSAPGAADLMIAQSLGTELIVPQVPPGQYYVRVRGVNSSGPGEASPEIVVRIGCGGAPPVAAGLTASVGPGGVVALAWDVIGEASGYLIEAGSAPGLADLAVIPVGAAAVSVPAPSGTYFVRVKAVTPCGITMPSNEVEVVVP